MQPYFLPYIGYWQLINAVDMFVVYDNIQYTKKGWINRNRLLRNGQAVTFTVPLLKDSDYLDVKDRELSPVFDRKGLLNQFREAYRRAPYFERTLPLLDLIVQNQESNLFRFVHNSIVKICEHLGITTQIVISSEIEIDHSLKNQDKVLALCKKLKANSYLNPIGGTDLYSAGTFSKKEIDLLFIKSHPFEYPQLGSNFVPWLSIVDVLMFNDVLTMNSILKENYTIL